MNPNRETHAALWDHIDRTAEQVDTWPYWKRGGGFAEAEDRARAAASTRGPSMPDDQMWVPPAPPVTAPITAMTGVISYGHLACTCSMVWYGVCPPPPCPAHTTIGRVVIETASTPSPLSDADVDRIARRVRELQRSGE
jgi:hypothetical protein